MPEDPSLSVNPTRCRDAERDAWSDAVDGLRVVLCGRDSATREAAILYAAEAFERLDALGVRMDQVPAAGTERRAWRDLVQALRDQVIGCAKPRPDQHAAGVEAERRARAELTRFGLPG